MKKIKYLSAIVMILSSFIGIFQGFQPVSAQETAITPVAVDVQVYLAMYGSEPVPQGQISYDIIQTDPQTNEGTVVYRYRSNEPSSGPLMLEPGNYKFRLYDGGNFERDGQALQPALVEQTIPTLSEEDIAQGNNTEALNHSGDLIPWGDGTVVLDVPFTVELGDNLLNEAGNQYESQLIVTIADQQSAGLVPGDGQESGEDTPEDTPEETGSLTLQVVGNDSSFVSEAVVEVNGETYTTDAQGLIQVDEVPAGEVQLNVVSVPEDYSTENLTVNPVTVLPQQVNSATITVDRIPQEPDTNTVTLTVVDEALQPVPNVSITLNEREIYTEANGQAVFSEVPTGEVTYTVNSVPEGYALEQTTGVILVDPVAPAEATINLTTETVENHIVFNVINENNEPVSGVDIVIAENMYTTSENGQVTTDELPVGGYSYSVASVPEGYNTPEENSVNIVESAPTEETITLTQAIEYGTAVINVTDENQQPIIGAEITLDEQTFVTNGSGQAIIEGLEANQTYEYFVSALPESYLMEGDAEIRTIDVLPNQQVEDTLVITQPEQVGVAIFTVLDEEGQPVPNIEVVLGTDSATTDAAGMARFEDVGPGTYTYQLNNLPEQYETPVEGQVTVTVNEETAQEITLSEIDQFGNVTFTIEDQDGEPIQDAQVSLNENTYPSNANGQIIIEGLNAGQTYNYTLTSLPENYNGQASGTVTIEANTNVDETITVERQLVPGQLSISVIDQNSQPVNGAVIQLNNEQTATTNEQGIAQFNDLTEGTYEYTIQTLPENYEHNIGTQSVYLAEGATEERQLQVQHQAQPGTVIFNVLDQDDHPVEGAVVEINNTTITTNAEGTATLSELEPNNYTYSITELPEGFTGNPSGEVTVNEDEITTIPLSVEREVELSTAQIKVVDQNGDPVSEVSVAFGGLTGTTNAEGLVNFESLEPGRYNYSVSSAPSGYFNNAEAQSTEIEEGSAFEAEFTIEKLPETGAATIKVVDNNNQPVEGVQIQVNDNAQTSDSQGNMTFEELIVGTHSYQLISLPDNIEVDQENGEFEVTSNEMTQVTVNATILESSSSEESSYEESSSEESSSESSSTEETSSQTESSSVNVDESQSLTPAQQASIDEEALSATRQFFDNETGIEVWVNPQDAANIDRVNVDVLDSAPSLENSDSDIYTISLLDANNNPVQLTRIAEIKIPTRPVTSQLRVIRVIESNNANLTFALHNQRVTFRTQQLGTFAVVYNAEQASISQESDQGSVSVSVESSVEENDDDLPNTGESTSRSLLIMVVIALLSGAYLIFTRNKSTEEE